MEIEARVGVDFPPEQGEPWLEGRGCLYKAEVRNS